MKVKAYIASLQDHTSGRHVLGDAEIYEYLGDNSYRAETNGVLCRAIYNPFTDAFYVDDLYSVEMPKSV